MAGVIMIFLNNKKLSSLMAQISEWISYSNQKNHSHYQMRKILLTEVVMNNKTKTTTHAKSVIYIIRCWWVFLTPLKRMYQMMIWKSDMIKVRKSSINSSSTLFYCSICAMYNIFYCAQNKSLMLKSYIPGINTLVFIKRHYDNIFSEKLVNELHAWIENHPNVIH